MSEIRIESVAEIARVEFEKLCEEFPEQREFGGTLFLGRCYADQGARVLMLGLNPGGLGSELETYLQPANCLVDEFPTTERYWRNARFLFGATSPALRRAMEKATYSFVCPFRTRSWSGSPALIAALQGHSRPILLQMLRDCRPRLVIIAGVAGLRAFRDILHDAVAFEQAAFTSSASTKGTYQWQAIRMALDGVQSIVAQIPHLSRANSRERLAECGRWLESVLLQNALRLA